MRQTTKIQIGVLVAFVIFMLLQRKVDKNIEFVFLLASVVTVYSGALFVLPSMAKAKRNRRFSTRSIQNFDEIYNQHYQPLLINKDIALGVHEAIAKDIGVRPSQIQPSDCFGNELCIQEWWGIIDDEFDYIEEYLFDAVGKEFDWPDAPLDYFWSLETKDSFTVQDLLIRLNDLFRTHGQKS
jgi:hypothetical protein